MKTTTLEDKSGNPTLVTCPGFVDRKTFNKAQSKEWKCDPISAKDWKAQRRYEFMIPHQTKAWKQVDAGTPGAKKFTVVCWD